MRKYVRLGAIACLFLLLGMFVAGGNGSLVAAKAEARYTVNLDLIRRIHCGGQLGTGFLISSGVMVTAYHVTEEYLCADADAGFPIYSSKLSVKKDTAVMDYPLTTNRVFMKYSCEGYRKGESYYAIGFAGGTDFVMNRVVASRFFTPKKYNIEGTEAVGLRILRGHVMKGMSGGPIVDGNGVVVGIINATGSHLLFGPIAMSRELKDTSVCKKP